MSNNMNQSLMIFLALALWTATVLFTWRLVFHSYAPKIKFSKKIHSSKAGKHGTRYHIQFQNTGKRTIFNGEFRASLFLKQHNLSNVTWQEIPIPFNQYGELKAKVARVEPLEENHGGESHKITLQLNFLEPNQIPVEGSDDAHSLENILTSGAYLQAWFSGVDMVTGIQHKFNSKKYRINDIS